MNMNIWIKLTILLSMFFLHIIGDFILQTDKMACMKQKEWWEEYFKKYQDPYAEFYMYRHDYKIVIVLHSFLWSFLISLPLLFISFINNNDYFMILFIVSVIENTIVHTYVDNKKANKHLISLVNDQITHIVQIIFTWIFTILMFA